MSENNTHNTPPIKKSKTKKFFAFIFRCLFYICIVLISAIGTGAGIGYYYQDEVKEYVIGELNKQLSTPVIVDGNNIELTIIKNFPLASIDFKNVSALDAIESTKKDTLFEASHISMQFSIIDIFKKNYTVKKIKIENTKLHIKIDKNGKSNYHFWKTLSDTSSTQFKFALEKIILKNISVLYENKRTKQSAEFQINESTISGNFSDKNYSMNIKSDFFIHKIL
ncbi:MAG: hypothetical protein JNL69_06245, partial [Bacteroidia bacterium]|nr:hypothetical protein [Bacteroidia bacterium]